MGINLGALVATQAAMNTAIRHTILNQNSNSSDKKDKKEKDSSTRNSYDDNEEE